jgi:hypothetical protein
VAVEVAAAVGFLVAAGFEVGFFAVPSVADLLAAGVEAADALEPPPAPICVAIPAELVVENCGGVIAITAPSPPIVPPAINNARFISHPYPQIPQKIYIPNISPFT